MENLILQYLKPELLVLVPVLYFIGLALKKSKINDKYIPLVLGACGVILAFLYVVSLNGFSVACIGMSIVQGVLAAAGSVYFNQLWKQIGKGNE